MFPPFPTEQAERYCRLLMRRLDEDKSLCPELGDDRLSTDNLFEEGHGQMFGVLVCSGCNGNQVVLKAFSGQYNGIWLVPGWVPPLLDVAAYDAQVEQDDARIKEMTVAIDSIRYESVTTDTSSGGCLEELKSQRRRLSRQSLDAIYRLYRFPCADGKSRGFTDVMPGFATGSKLPPTGTGDCCAPKLLGYAFSHGLLPLSLAEFFYGASGRSGRRVHKEFYPPCDEKCALVLPSMLGLEIVYLDESIVVVNKPAGLLSVPGRGEANQDCVSARVRRLFPDCITQPAVHRLDMDTSGLMVLAFTTDAHRKLSSQFMAGTIHKEYEALLRGRLVGRAAFDGEGRPVEHGRIELPFRLDTENRPRQVYDDVHGKMGITEWTVVERKRCRADVSCDKVLTRVRFVPRTGRTHQLRLHSMHALGLGAAIQGDRLYGVRLPGERLMLHSARLEFVHPVTGCHMVFSSRPPF